MPNKILCPFSKPIIGGWCTCDYANLEERCSGKMSCKRSAELLSSCSELVNSLKENSRFVLGLHDDPDLLTHAQLMKIRCGGLLGMQRVLELGDHKPDVRTVIDKVNERFESVDSFPFNEIMPDIKHFSHRSGSSK
jgi:hypothetical protein